MDSNPLHGSEEFERRKDILRLLGMEYRFRIFTNDILYEGELYAQSVHTEDHAWEMAWSRLNKSIS